MEKERTEACNILRCPPDQPVAGALKETSNKPHQVGGFGVKGTPWLVETNLISNVLDSMDVCLINLH